jgi:hypothetical protein
MTSSVHTVCQAPCKRSAPPHSYPTSNHFPPLTGRGVLYGLDNALSFLLIQFLLLGEAPSDVSAPGAFLLGEVPSDALKVSTRVLMISPAQIVNPPHPPPLDTQILSTTMSKCLVCAPASSPIYLLALSTLLHPRTPHFIAYALHHTKLHSSITTLAALVLLHPQHYRSRLLRHCLHTWYPLTSTFPQSCMSQ